MEKKDIERKKIDDLFVRYNEVCNEITRAFAEKYDVSVDDEDWTKNHQGGVFVNEIFYINLDDVIMMLDKDVSFDEFIRWWDYCEECRELGLGDCNLRAWVMNCPRHSKESIERLKSLRQELNDLIKEENSKINKF